MIIGIDLGTTNSLVAVLEKQGPKIIPNSLNKLLTPSVISMNDNGILIGEPALQRLVTHPELTASHFKRFMGTDKIFKLGDTDFRAEELSSLILKRLKEDAENYLGCTVDEAVISVPAYFSEQQRKATKLAGKLAGLKVERIINEPTAAGIAYGLNQEKDDTNYLIFDLGGGTFDVSVLNYFSQIIEVRSSCGDNYLGGVDFTETIENIFIQKILAESAFDTKNIPLQLSQRIREQAELTKFSLSLQSAHTMEVLWDNKVYQCEITQDVFETHAKNLLNRIQNPIKKVINDSKLKLSDIDQIVLVGGASRMPLIRKLVARMFGKLPLCHQDPDGIIALGCAVQAGLKENHQTLDEVVVTDVAPYSLGISACDSSNSVSGAILYFEPIIERNCTVPTSKAKVFSPVHQTQTEVLIKIYQGENIFVEKNIFLGSLSVIIPPKLTNQAFEVRFTYDINGLLEVEATFLENQHKKSLVIEGTPGAMSHDEIEARLIALKALKIHPREQTENLSVIALAERIYADLQGQRRLQVGYLLTDFVQVLESQDTQRIQVEREKLQAILADIKSE